jgi:general secretion pathway protein D
MRLPRLLPCLALLLIPALGRAQPVPAPTPAATPPAAAAPPSTVQKLVLRDAPLDLVLAELETWTGKIVLRPQALPAAIITLNIAHEVSRDEAVHALESVLELNGIGIVYMGDKYIKVVDLATKARIEASRLLEGPASDEPASNMIATKIFELNYLRPQDVVTQLNLFLNPATGGAIAFANSPFFSVTDTVANLQRVEVLVNKLDHPTTPTVEPMFYPLVNAQAAAVATTINALVQGPLQALVGAANITLSADTRTNQLIVVGAKEQFPLFAKLVKELDKPASPVTSNQVIRLKNATASVVVQELHNIIAGQQQALSATSPTSTAPRATTPAAPRGGTTGGVAAPAATTTTNRATTAPQAAVTAQSVAGSGVNGQGTSTTDFSSYLSFTNDDRTNSIVATGTPQDLKILTKMIDDLDFILQQVRIEVLIVDVTLTNEFDTGISALGLQMDGNKLTAISGTAAGGSLSGSGAQTGNSTTMALVANPLTMANPLDRTGLTGLLSLTTTPGKGKAFILSAPTIATAHNTTGSIFVGETVPIATGSVTVGGTGGVTTTIGQIQIGITLSVTPLIGADGTVQMSISTEVSDSSSSVTIDGNPQPVINTRQTSDYVSCKTGEIIVLGGQRRKSDKLSTSLLAGIPLLGELLGSSSHQQETDDLIFMVRPVVLDNKPSDNAGTMKEIHDLNKPDQISDIIGHPVEAVKNLINDKDLDDPNADAQPAPAGQPAPGVPAAQNNLQRPPR